MEMLKILIIVFTLYELSNVPGNKACNENILDEPLDITLTLPHKRKTFQDLCPAETKKDIDKLKKFSTTFSFVWKHCLFQKQFEPAEKKLCRSEMKPIFSYYAYRDGTNLIKKECGPKKEQFLHYFGYFYCGAMKEAMIKLHKMTRRNYKQKKLKFEKEEKVSAISMYDVCYDRITLKTVYTSHKVLQPSADQELFAEEPPYCTKKISTDIFYLKYKAFFKIERHYQQEKNKNLKSQQDPENKYRMLPYPMVPPEHFPYRTWKKPTNHYINMAPLWEDLVPLMRIIDEVIKKVATNVFQISKGKEELRILTKVEDFVPSKKSRYNSESFINVTKWLKPKSHIFQPNIWYKLLYNETRKEGIMIYIHNSPEQPITKKCSEDNAAKCNFQKFWSNSLINNHFESNPLITKHFDYVYCCRTTTKKVKEIFFEDLTIENVLDLDSKIITPPNHNLYSIPK